jgi:hypothetical protein
MKHTASTVPASEKLHGHITTLHAAFSKAQGKVIALYGNDEQKQMTLKAEMQAQYEAAELSLVAGSTQVKAMASGLSAATDATYPRRNTLAGRLVKAKPSATTSAKLNYSRIP